MEGDKINLSESLLSSEEFAKRRDKIDEEKLERGKNERNFLTISYLVSILVGSMCYAIMIWQQGGLLSDTNSALTFLGGIATFGAIISVSLSLRINEPIKSLAWLVAAVVLVALMVVGGKLFVFNFGFVVGAGLVFVFSFVYDKLNLFSSNYQKRIE